MKIFLLALLLATAIVAQQAQPTATDPSKPAAQKAPGDNPVNEQFELQQALGQSGGSPAEFIRILEEHLKKHPNSERRAELERVIFKAALETHDDARIVQYGEKLAAAEKPDLETLDRYSRALLADESKDKAVKALQVGKRLEETLLNNDNEAADQPGKLFKSGRDRARFREEMDRSMSRALMTEAKASGILGKLDDAIDMSQRAFNTYPSMEAAHERARWQLAAGHQQEAITALADAFTLAEAKAANDRAADRKQIGELYTKLKGSEAGLGDVLLQSYDRLSVVMSRRRDALRALDPNLDQSDPLEFTLSNPKGGRLALASLKGKVIILDFWATWCGPCRAQYPLYEEVKKKYKDRDDVIFLAISTDEDRDAVEPFLKEQNWNKNVYFEDGLSNLLRVSSIPTTVVFGRTGKIAARMNGFLPEQFVDMLSARIDAELGASPAKRVQN
jgi:thiol-disulfide isomerase/thioredoxin